MNERNPSDRIAGWALAGALFVHLLLLRDPAAIVLVSYLILAVGAVLRSRQIFAPAWLERSLFLLAVLVVFLTRRGTPPYLLIGELAGIVGAVFLLRPITPSRGLRVVFCILAVLVAAIIRPYPGVGAVFLVLDVVVLMILTQQIHRPPEAAQSFWASLVRSLRVVVPVSIVVILVFWLFPDYSIQTMPAITGFSGSNVLDPGRVAELSQSRRVALVAKFPEAEQVPEASQLYWRGQVLERNEGLRWSRDSGRRGPPQSLETGTPDEDVPIWRYSQEVTSNRGGILPILDRVVTVDASRGGQEIAVLDLGASVLTAVGAGSLRMDVVAAADSASDAPAESFGQGSLGVPEEIGANPELRQIAAALIAPDSSTPEALRAVAAYFKENQFAYTMRPGRIPNVGKFLTTIRRGFCEHYAAAAANLLRLGGVPARIVVGYRGGDWNPWLRTITVRDSDAHAWVEAWDAPSSRWMRFDPTNSVAPDLTTQLENDLDSDTWPWWRLSAAFVSAFFTEIGDRTGEFFAVVGASEMWESLQPVFFVGLLLFLTAWLARRLILRHMQHSRDLAASLLTDLEFQAVRLGRPRLDRETPLAWLRRLQDAASDAEKETLDRFATAYTTGVYRAEGLTPAVANELRDSASRLKKIWKARRRGTVKIAS